MQAAQFEDSVRRPCRIHQNRTWRVSAAVVLAHVGVAWLIGRGVLTHVIRASALDKVIMASVVMDAPAPHAPAAPARQPEPVTAKMQTQLKPQPKPDSPQGHPAPVLTPTVPSDAAPIAPSAQFAQPTPFTAAAPLAVTQQRPAANTTAAAVVLPSTNADYLNNPAPPYPRLSKRMGEEGTVVIRVLITTEGRAGKAEVRTSSGHARLDDTALSTVQRWRFVPGQRNGVAEAMWFNVPIRFVLD
jgi:protein TonB